MRLLVFLPSRYRGGAEEYALSIAKGAKAAHWDVHMSLTNNEECKSILKDIKFIGAKHHFIKGLEGKTTKWKLCLQFISALITIFTVKPNVIQIVLSSINNKGVGVLYACSLVNMPSVVCYRLVPDKTTVNPRITRLYSKILTKKQNYHFIAVSDNNRKILINTLNIKPTKIGVIKNGIDVKKFIYSNQEINNARYEIRKELNLKSDAYLIITVGEISYRKGYDLFVPVISNLYDNYLNICWVWVGAGTEWVDFNKLLVKYGAQEFVKLVGQREDIPDLLNAADLFIFPTRAEGQPRALLEAMAAKLPIVASDASGIPEIITNKVNGLLFKNNDSIDLKNKTKFAIDNPEVVKNFAKCAFENVQYYTEKNMIEDTLSLLHNLSKKRKL